MEDFAANRTENENIKLTRVDSAQPPPTHQPPVAVVGEQVVVAGNTRRCPGRTEPGRGRCIFPGLSQGRRHQQSLADQGLGLLEQAVVVERAVETVVELAVETQQMVVILEQTLQSIGFAFFPRW